MKEGAPSELWRLGPELSVEDAAILIAGGDPEAVDYEPDSFGRECPFKRTDGHPGYRPAFNSLTNAIRKGQLPAELALKAKRTLGNIPSETWFLSSLDSKRLQALFQEKTSVEVSFPDGSHIEILAEPDWNRTRIDVEDLKRWLVLRGHSEGFFFPPDNGEGMSNDALMNSQHERFAPELALAVSAWRGLEGQNHFARGSKAAIESWIGKHPEAWRGDMPLSGAAKERIATVVNWNKSGGAPSSST